MTIFLRRLPENPCEHTLIKYQYLFSCKYFSTMKKNSLNYFLVKM